MPSSHQRLQLKCYINLPYTEDFPNKTLHFEVPVATLPEGKKGDDMCTTCIFGHVVSKPPSILVSSRLKRVVMLRPLHVSPVHRGRPGRPLPGLAPSVRKRPAPPSFQSWPSRLSMVATFASSNVPVAAQRAAKITGFYIGVIGIALFVAPVTCFSILFDPSEIEPIWIRVFGSLCALLGWYYRGASQDSILDCW